MATPMSRKMKAIHVPEKRRFDASNINEEMKKIRTRVFDVTLELIRGLSRVSDPTTFPNVARGLIMVAMSTPIRCMCVGIKPYDNGILPAFATALAYNPEVCDGVTPSVQVLSQAMSIYASYIKSNFLSKHPDVDPNKMMNRYDYTRNFACMLRCSYACLEAGVAFVNANPVITASTSHECMSMSLFSEWVAKVVMIHGESGCKIKVTCMGELAEEMMSDATSAYPMMNTHMTLVNCRNPAAIARMNVNKTSSVTPIQSNATMMETYLEETTTGYTNDNVAVRFSWNNYPDSILWEHVGYDAVRPCVELLVDRAPDELLNKFVNSIRRVFSTMADLDIESMMSAMAVPAEADDNQSHASLGGNNQYHPETASGVPTESKPVPFNPFGATATSASGPSGSGGDGGGAAQGPFARQGGGGGGHGQGGDGGQGQGGRRGYDGPVGALQRTQLGQLLDPTGKGVSQQVIVINSINQRAAEIITAYKQMNKDMVQLVQRQAQLMDRVNMAGQMDEDIVASADSITSEYTDFVTEVMSNMETAFALLEGLPAVIEGDTGIYNKETVPVAPLLRREDGTTMQHGVYGPVHKMARLNEATNRTEESSYQQPQQTQTQPFATVDSREPSAVVTTGTSLVEGGDMTYRDNAREWVMKSIKRYVFDSGMKPKQVYKNIQSVMIKYKSTDASMFDVMSAIVSEKMSIDGGKSIPTDVMDNIISCLGSGSIEDIEGMVEIFGDAVEDRTSLKEFYQQIATPDSGDDDDDDESEDDSESEDEE